MSPIDSSPHGAEVPHPPAEPRYPQPGPGQESDEPVRGQPAAGAGGDVQPGVPARPGETGPDVVNGRRDPILGTGNDVAG